MSKKEGKRIDIGMRVEAGKRIEDLRVCRKMSREDVAYKAGISTKFLYEVEKGRKGVSAEILLRIARVLSSSCDYILTGKKTVNKRNAKDILNKFDPVNRKIMEEIVRLIYELANDR